MYFYRVNTKRTVVKYHNVADLQNQLYSGNKQITEYVTKAGVYNA